MSEYYKPIFVDITAAEDGMQVKKVLSSQLGISRRLLTKIKVTPRGIEVNGERQHVNYVVQKGDVIAVRMLEEDSDYIQPERMDIDILYEDDTILVLNKQAGVVVHPTTGHHTGTLGNGVVYYWQQKGEHYRYRPAHRLDQYTSGVFVIAKNPYAHQNIAKQMEEGTVNKQYIAFVHGNVETSHGTVNAPIGRDDEDTHLRVVREDGYDARTHYEVQTRYEGATLVRCWLETGRTHQIRVHMKHLGHPLIGDAMYAPSNVYAFSRQALHAETLSFQHPTLKERCEFTAPWPEDLHQLQHILSDKKDGTNTNKLNGSHKRKE
ncbi:RluA family pseudouridine synthase [Longirhabdus pacifica]|uniref:RluA family pseudouridine synthase n=1 Tax=Longirhabdus pacifica TaxID=2305227 RepID=UPI00100923FE|nr:RluA family pseudouridine synthase [Longirhabdus pacifica]